MTNLFSKIAAENARLDGWCSLPKAFTLAGIVLAIRPEVSVEIGVYGGRSLIPMALAHQAIGRGAVWGIDPWSNHVAVREQTTNVDREWWGKSDLEGLFRKVMSAIELNQLAPFTKIIRNESQFVPPPRGISLLHVDGSHSDTATRDIVAFAPNVTVGGFVVMDDLAWAGGGPQRGEQRLLQLGFRKLYALETGAVFQRVK